MGTAGGPTRDAGLAALQEPGCPRYPTFISLQGWPKGFDMCHIYWYGVLYISHLRDVPGIQLKIGIRFLFGTFTGPNRWWTTPDPDSGVICPANSCPSPLPQSEARALYLNPVDSRDAVRKTEVEEGMSCNVMAFVGMVISTRRWLVPSVFAHRMTSVQATASEPRRESL